MKKNLRTNLKWGLLSLCLSLMTLVHAQSLAYVGKKDQQNPLERSVENSSRLSFNATSALDVFKTLERQFNVRFLYRENDLNKKQIFSLDAGDYNLNTVLDKMSKTMNFKYKQVGSIVSLSFNNDIGQKIKEEGQKAENAPAEIANPITGTIKNAAGESLIGVSILVKGTTRGTVTDENGNFSLDAKEGEILVVSSVGYDVQEVKVGKEPILNISLKSNDAVLVEVAVVGSRGKPRTDVNRPVPVDVLNAKDLQATGQVELGQQVQFTSPSFNSTKNGINGIANYADPASLRGLSPDQLLVTVDGKRRHQFSAMNTNVTVGKGTVVTDLNTIPTLAIERVEVLRDGAAAQYGSDAIAGIVNLALKKSVNKGIFKIQSGVTKVGDGFGYTADLNYGFKLGKEGSYLNLTGSYQNTGGTDRSDFYNGTIYNATKAKDDSIRIARGYWAKSLSDSFKVSKYGSNETKAGSFFYNLGYPIGKNWSLYSFGGYSQKNIYAFGFLRTAIPSSSTSDPELYPDGFSPRLPGTSVDYSTVIGAKRSVIDGWNMDFSTGYGYNYLDQWANGTANPSLGAASPTDFYIGRIGFGQSTTEANLSKNLGTFLGTKSFNLALGSQLRVDNFTIAAGDPAASQTGPLAATKGKAPGSTGRAGISADDATDKSRTNIGVYADVETDITDKFLIATALRYENYSDFGSNVSGKLAGRYKITDNFSIRGSINRGFRAPLLQQIANTVTTSTVQNNLIYLTKELANSDPLLKKIGIDDPKPEFSWNYNLGLTAKAGNNFLFTIDAYQIDITDRIILSEGLAVSKIAALKSVFTGYQQISFFTNQINTTTQGVDFVTTFKHSFNEKNRFNASLAFTLNKTSITSVKPTPDLLQAGTTTPVLLIDTVSRSLIETSQPHNKVLLSLGYQLNKIYFNARATYFGEVTSWELPSGGFHRSQTFSGKTLFDLSVVYNVTPKFLVTVGANNITDVYPDKVYSNYASYTNGQVPYTRNSNQFGFNGAYYYGSLTYNF